jgi:hypothetical protein
VFLIPFLLRLSIESRYTITCIVMNDGSGLCKQIIKLYSMMYGVQNLRKYEWLPSSYSSTTFEYKRHNAKCTDVYIPAQEKDEFMYHKLRHLQMIANLWGIY